MNDKELEGRLRDIHERLERIENKIPAADAWWTSFMVLCMFATFLSKGCSFQ